KYYNAWHSLWKNKWTEPYNRWTYKHPLGNIGSYTQQTYWLLSVIERAASTDAEKIIKVWEGDSYEMASGKVISMRACDHKAVQPLHIFEFVEPEKQKESFNIEPYSYFDGCSNVGPIHTVPADKIMPWMDPKLDRCK
ncbi:MAG: hypothetical protein JRE14_05475, partial [Deltaproteobacteria bacterium]|nr:hypothetical protein [Deltaproteobacteria bacterium]